MAEGGGAEVAEGNTEFYRVFVTDIPPNVSKEEHVKAKCTDALPGEAVAVNTQGSNTCAVVTMRCREGECKKVERQLKIDQVTIHNWGTFNATISMENVPEDVKEEFSRRAQMHGVSKKDTPTGVCLCGSIEGLYNLRADVDYRFMSEQSKKLDSAKMKPLLDANSEKKPLKESSNPSSPDPRPPGFSLRPSPLDARHSKSPPYPGINPASAVPSSAVAVSSTVWATGPFPGNIPAGPGAKVNDWGKPRDPLTKDAAEGSGDSLSGPKSPPPSSNRDSSSKAKVKTVGDLYPDALALVQRLPEGNIPEVEYHVQEGYVRITSEGKKKTEETISKFQDAYKKVFAPGQKLRVEGIEVPDGCTKKDVRAEIATFENRFVSTAFVLDEEKRVVRVISQSRQLEQAKVSLEKALQRLVRPPSAAPCAPMVIKFSENRTLTLKKGNIVEEKADILVNAANGQLDHAGGVARALNIASKKELQRYSDTYMRTKLKGKEIQAGNVVWTEGGGNLACKRVIHAIGPEGWKHSPQQCEHLLKQVVQSTLNTAEHLKASSIVFPAISCGVFGVNRDLVAHCITDAILGYNYSKPSPSLSDIRIVIIDEPSHASFARYLQEQILEGSSRSRKGAVTNAESSSNRESLQVPLCSTDLDWITPLLRHAAPKWKMILHTFGVTDKMIAKLMKQSNDEYVLLNIGMLKLVEQSKASPGVSLANLVEVLQSPDVGEEDTAANLMKVAVERRGATGDSSSALDNVTYPNLAPKKATTTPHGCPICLGEFTSPVETKCKHIFCKKCLDECMKHSPYCPMCHTPLRTVTGNQPLGGTMRYSIMQRSVPGYRDCNTIKIEYWIPGGIQGPEHPNPGQPYQGTNRDAYLPDNPEGAEVLKLLHKAFEARMIFTIGTSVTRGTENTIVWNDIHHKTSISGVPYGYPDPTYLQRVKEDLAAKGIAPDPVL